MENLSRFGLRKLGLLLAVFSLTVAVACGGDGDDEAASSSGGTAPGGGSAAASQLAQEQVLRLSMSADPSTIDPQLVSVANEISIARQLGSGLFTYDEALNVVPAVAKTVPTIENGGISADGTQYSIALNETTWSDGSPLTADDFAYSILRALDPEVGSPYAWAYYDIVGAQAYNTLNDAEDGAPLPPAAEIDQLRENVGISVVGDYEISFTLESPNPIFLNVLAHFAAFPVKQSVIEQYGESWTNPEYFLGNGPFVLSQWERDSRIVLSRNNNWYGTAPTLTSIEVSIISDASVALNSYANSEIDVVDATEASLAAGTYSDEQRVTADLSTFALFMNNAVEPFDNQLVRQAFGSAIDRDAYVSGVLQGAGIPATSWVPPGMPGHNDALEVTFDVARAQELLSEAGYANGEGLGEIQFIGIASDRNTLVSQFIESQLETNLGVEVSFDLLDEGEYFDELFAGNYDAVIQEWFADWPTADNFLYGLFHSEGGLNFAAYNNPEFDQLMDDAIVAPNPADRAKLYDDAQRLLLLEAAISPMYYDISNTYVKPSIADLIMTGLDGELKGDLFFWRTKILALE